MENNLLNKDDDDYIDISQLKDNYKFIYQIQINNAEITQNIIGKSDKYPDIIIKENFGYNNEYNLLSCVYTYEELYKNEINLIPLVKLINSEIIASISIKYNKDITDFEIYYILYDKNKKIDITEKLEKTINKNNILEILLTKTIDCGIKIL